MSLTIKKIETEKMVDIISSITADRPWVLVEENDEQRIWREQGCVHLMDYDVDIYQAVSECYSDDTGDYEINSDLHIFYVHDTTDELFRVYDQSLPMSIYNYFFCIGRKDLANLEVIDNLSCSYLLNWDRLLK